ncbi:MAG: hypothetical protein VX494_04090 [Actinomycetota bacterium]|nr:hypothetical protein [Actinomycetota bacterium]
MTLPPLDGQGLLPVGRHATDPQELHDVFVDGAPSHKSLREDLLAAYLVWSVRVHQCFGPGRVWLGDTFATHWVEDPALRVCFFPAQPIMAEKALTSGDSAMGLLTLEDVIYSTPSPGGHITQMKAVGGMLDASLGIDELATDVDLLMSLVVGRRPGRPPLAAVTGYCELRI